MKVEQVTPILNVSNLQESFKWFEKIGWRIGWQWGEPAEFGGVCSGDSEIFLCQNGQGGRGRGDSASTFASDYAKSPDQGVWMSLWVTDVDEAYRHCQTVDVEVTWQPEDMPWNVREMHIRHPDGHVFRISQSLGG